MSDPAPDLLLRVLVLIRNQRKNLNVGHLTEDDVAMFHEQLDRLEEAGYDVSDFRVNEDRDMYRRVTSSNSLTGETTYAKHRNVNHGALETKMDAILDYFDLKGKDTDVEFRGTFSH